jgi:hypothetical protein
MYAEYMRCLARVVAQEDFGHSANDTVGLYIHLDVSTLEVVMVFDNSLADVFVLGNVFYMLHSYIF